MTTTITLSPSIKAALLQSVSASIDMLNDMALDPMWMNPQQVRELATKSDDEIRAEINANAKAANNNLDQLINLQLLYSELTSE